MNIPPSLWKKEFKLPKDAKRVFKGIIFEVYHYPQKLFDGSTSTFEILKRKNTVEIIPIKNNKIIVCEQQQPGTKLLRSLPGGRQEETEQPLQAAKRELLEETGLVSENWELFRIYEPSHKIIYKDYIFIARNCHKKMSQTLDPGEKVTLKEVSFKEFLNFTASENFWGTLFANDVFRIRSDRKKLKEFKSIIFK